MVRCDASLDEPDSMEAIDVEDAFEERDMAVERLACQGGAMLHDVDRFLTLARLSPGPVAIHGLQGPGLGSGGEVLVSSLLMQRHGFDARSALAWLRVCHPPAPPRVLAFSLLDEAVETVIKPSSELELDVQKRRRAWRTDGRFGSSAPALLSCRVADEDACRRALLKQTGSGRGRAWLARLLIESSCAAEPPLADSDWLSNLRLTGSYNTAVSAAPLAC